RHPGQDQRIQEQEGEGGPGHLVGVALRYHSVQSAHDLKHQGDGHHGRHERERHLHRRQEPPHGSDGEQTPCRSRNGLSWPRFPIRNPSFSEAVLRRAWPAPMLVVRETSPAIRKEWGAYMALTVERERPATAAPPTPKTSPKDVLE